MNFEKFNSIVENRLNYGELDHPTVVSEYKQTGCGDNYRIFLEIENDIIKKASYTTTGCSFSLASLGIICDLIKNKNLSDVKDIKINDIETYIDGYPEKRLHYATSAIESIQKAINDFRHNTGINETDRVSRKAIMEKLVTTKDLSGMQLSSAMLDGLDLADVNFSNANLQNVYLRQSNCQNANFTGANLKGGFLDNADFSGANFRKSDLRFAKLTLSNLNGADFTDAIYDIGTRVSPKDIHIFEKMIKKGKELYVKNN